MRRAWLSLAIAFGCAAPAEPARARPGAAAEPAGVPMPAPALASSDAAPSLAASPSPAPPSEQPNDARGSPSDSQPPSPSTRGAIVLVPLGSFPADLLDAVAERLERELSVEVRRHDPVPLPHSAWYAPRKRYRAEKLLDHLATFVPEDAPGGARVLGLTRVDISTTKAPHEDWGIFGLGQMPGRTAVVSMHRLARRVRDRDHLRFRVSIVALHEAGHTFGLDHCDEPRCPMQDAEGSIANTDTSAEGLAAGCRAQLESAFPIAP